MINFWEEICKIWFCEVYKESIVKHDETKNALEVFDFSCFFLNFASNYNY